MKMYAVSFTADMIIEVEAPDAEWAKAMIAEAFARANPIDPLSGMGIVLNRNAGTHGVIQTTTIQDWSVEDIEAEAV